MGEPVPVPNAAARPGEQPAHDRVSQHRYAGVDQGGTRTGGAPRHQSGRRAMGAARDQLDVGEPRRRADRAERAAGRERHVHLPGPRAADRRYLFIAPPTGDRRHRVDGGSRRLPHHHCAAAGGHRAPTGRDDHSIRARDPVGPGLRARWADVRDRARREHPHLRECRAERPAAGQCLPGPEHQRVGRVRAHEHRARPGIRYQQPALRLRLRE